MNTHLFKQKVNLICDPYFDREFFTNLIYCIDRGTTRRQLFEAVMQNLIGDASFATINDRSLLHFFYSYSASSELKETYQWLPFAQGLYTLALFRGDGQKPLPVSEFSNPTTTACTLEDFERLIKGETRAVESFDRAWTGLLFLLENRSLRSAAIARLLRTAALESDPLSFELLVKGLELAMASGWMSNAAILYRPFRRFWNCVEMDDVVVHGWRLSQGVVEDEEVRAEDTYWTALTLENLWTRLSQSAESAWEVIVQGLKSGSSVDNIFYVLGALRGRCLNGMKSEQWPLVVKSILWSDSMRSASHWVREDKTAFVAADLCDLVRLRRQMTWESSVLPTGKRIMEEVSATVSKDRLIFRLDDAVERGDRREALDLLAVIAQDQGLSHSLSDRLVLMASKQDGWTFDCMSIPVALILTRTFENCARLNIRGDVINEALFGLLRFLADQRELSLEIIPRTGTYGDLHRADAVTKVLDIVARSGHGDITTRSSFDVSGGARIVDRFVFNQIRNAQRVKIWPSDD